MVCILPIARASMRGITVVLPEGIDTNKSLDHREALRSIMSQDVMLVPGPNGRETAWLRPMPKDHSENTGDIWYFDRTVDITELLFRTVRAVQHLRNVLKDERDRQRQEERITDNIINELRRDIRRLSGIPEGPYSPVGPAPVITPHRVARSAPAI